MAAGRVEGGWLRVWASDKGVWAVEWPQEEWAEEGPQGPQVSAAAAQMAGRSLGEVAEYLARQRRDFSVPVDWDRLRGFTRQVLEACAQVPYGETVSYGELARLVGSPGAARAVGQALGRNPVPLIVPCHRVVASGEGWEGLGEGWR